MSELQYFTTSGTLGDSYITMLKLLSYEHPVKLHHFVRGGHKYWQGAIEWLLRLAPCVHDIEATESLYEHKDSPRIYSNFKEPDPEGIVRTYFPEQLDLGVEDFKPRYQEYAVVCTNSGKPSNIGGNTKRLSEATINYALNVQMGVPKILIGTEAPGEFSKGRLVFDSRCTNYVGMLQLNEAVDLVSRAKYFLGPEGLLLFVALSNKITSTGLYTSQEAMDVRVNCSPWSSYATLLKCNADKDGFLKVL